MKKKKGSDFRAFLHGKNQIRELSVPGYDQPIKYALLTLKDLREIQRQTKDPTEMGFLAIERSLKKAYPNITKEEIEQLPLEVYLAISEALFKHFTELNRKFGFLKRKSDFVG
ncbi:hypothetical protein J7L13_00410 [bacterium]|nr:hypothetical protein [bacterium]